MWMLESRTHDTDPGSCIRRESVGGSSHQESSDLALLSSLLLLQDTIAHLDARRADKDTVRTLYERSNVAVVSLTKGAESDPFLLLVAVLEPSHRLPQCVERRLALLRPHRTCDAIAATKTCLRGNE